MSENGGIVVNKSGGITFDGPAAVNVFRLKTLLTGLRAEMRGMRLTAKAPSCFTIVKREHGLKGSKAKILAAFEEIVEKAAAQVPVTRK